MLICKSLEKNLSYLKSRLNSSDVEFNYFKISNLNAAVIYIKDITDKDGIGEFVIKPAILYNKKINSKNLKDIFLFPEKQVIKNLNDALRQIVSGNTILLIENVAIALSFGLKKFEKRTITEPPTSTVIKGPREGFVESLPVNISMIRRRLKTPDLIFEDKIVGKYSSTSVCLCYLKNIADKKLVETLHKKIQQIDIDAVLDSSYVSKFIGEKKDSLFKQIGNTEKPDILVAKILEGRVAILVDGSPIALTAPYLLIEDFQSPSDYYSSAYSATLARMLRFLAVFISIFLPAIFVSAELFHLQLIPLSFLLTIVNSIKGIPLSPSYEMFFTLVIFETLNEASVRMPKYVGMVVSIVGGLVLGETAVNAGIISAPTLMIIAFSGICLYTVPELEQTFSVIRLIFLIIGGSLGGFGIIIATAFMLIYLVSFENFSVPLMAPFSPLVTKDLKDSVIRSFSATRQMRPLSLKSKKSLQKIENSVKEKK